LRVEFDACHELLNRALDIGKTVGDELLAADVINYRGLLRVELGDQEGLDDLATSVRMYVELGSPYATMGKFHLARGHQWWNGPADAAPIFRDAIEHAARTGNPTYEMEARALDISRMEDAGTWDALLDATDHVTEWADRTGAWQHHTVAAAQKARVLALRGDLAGARTAIAGAIERSRRALDSEVILPTLSAAALIEWLDGNTAHARRLAEEVAPRQVNSATPLAEICRTLIACDAADHAQLLLDHARFGPPRLLNNDTSARAQLLEAERDHVAAAALYEDATIKWRSFGNPYELAHALAGQARFLAALHRAREAEFALATSIFTRLGVRGSALPSLPN
jgi:hypothetical protein